MNQQSIDAQWALKVYQQLNRLSHQQAAKISQNSHDPFQLTIHWKGANQLQKAVNVRLCPKERSMLFFNGNPHWVKSVEELLPEVFHHC